MDFRREGGWTRSSTKWIPDTSPLHGPNEVKKDSKSVTSPGIKRVGKWMDGDELVGDEGASCRSSC